MISKVGTHTIETARLLLRRFRVEDADAMYANWASDPEVVRYLTWPVHESPEITRKLLTDWTARYTDGCYFMWGIEEKETGSLIGNISVVRLDENTEAAEIGYCLSRAYWGRGIMTEALKAVMDFLFDAAGLNRVSARHDTENPASGRVMQKAGMRKEGIFRAAGRNNRGFCDLAYYAMIRSDRNPDAELNIRLQDYEWPYEYTDNDRRIARAVVIDDDGYFYFVHAERNDEFGQATLIETSGGGVEQEEDLDTAIRRELKEELGAETEVLGRIGVVSDYYNVIHRHNISHYFLCRAVSFGERDLTPDEAEQYKLTILKLTYEEALAEYEKRRETRLGRLVANRELPVLLKAKEMLRR